MSGTPRQILGDRLRDALKAAGFDPVRGDVSASADMRFGDYQSNAAMVLAKEKKSNPRQIAADILSRLDVRGISAAPEVAGAGFLNFRLESEFLDSALGALAADPRLGVATAKIPQKILLDFSSPNVAKPMHVGHIRSTILGDCLARIARFLGHEVITDNHIGDWGTQFGKVIYGWKHFLDREALARDAIAELVRLYREVNRMEETDEVVRRVAREELVKLQAGDAENLAIWKETVELSWREFEKLYGLLDIRFDERLGESAYNDALAPLCEELQRRGIARESEGALCIFYPGIPALAEKPAIIRKSDGGFLYATTDLATIEYRLKHWRPDAIWYVVGAPQALHFQQIFAACRMMGIEANLVHIAFGSILGEDRKIMKTRSGENVGLAEVLHEAVDRARKMIAARQEGLTPEALESIAETIGIGAVKYAELSQNRHTDYVFSWEKLLALDGNTAPYLQNAYVRIRSIFRRGEVGADPGAAIRISVPAERLLAIKLLQYAETVPVVLEDFRPNILANFLYELANTYHSFYEACPVLKAEPEVRASRLLLSELTARILSHGLSLLGIRCPEKM
ncbi:MAG: arginine--tRNA ligase [Chthoniobacterales bacterium]|nr:arginine--tRNA ligase [Chthoniobacterales bacterium]